MPKSRLCDDGGYASSISKAEFLDFIPEKTWMFLPLEALAKLTVENIYTIYIVHKTPTGTIYSISNLLKISFASGSLFKYFTFACFTN